MSDKTIQRLGRVLLPLTLLLAVLGPVCYDKNVLHLHTPTAKNVLMSVILVLSGLTFWHGRWTMLHFSGQGKK
jgi:hypothetical protein